MPRKRKIVIPEGVKCKSCGSVDLVGAGIVWRTNPDNDNPPRILSQKLQCRQCGLIFVDGEVIKKEK